MAVATPEPYNQPYTPTLRRNLAAVFWVHSPQALQPLASIPQNSKMYRRLLLPLTLPALLPTLLSASESTPILPIATSAGILQERQSFGNKDGNFQPTRGSDPDEPTQILGALAVDGINDQDGTGAGEDVYVLYTGNGTVEAGWPDIGDWVSFEDMWEANRFIMESSCSRVYWATDNSQGEIDALHGAISTVAAETLLDHRFIFAIVLQESGGCVRVPTSFYGLRNPGLMQCHNGNATCNEAQTLDPCPETLIDEMVREGASGTDDGDGLVQCVNDQESEHVRGFYRGARCYNSGAVAESGVLEEGGATACYASDVANRLMGWVEGGSGCWF